MTYFILMILILIISCGSPVSKNPQPPHGKRPSIKKQKRKAPGKAPLKKTHSKQGAFKTVSINEQGENGEKVGITLKKAKVFLVWDWESINHWYLKPKITLGYSQPLWPFPHHNHRLWMGFYNKNDYGVLIEFEAGFETSSSLLRYGRIKLGPRSGWHSPGKPRNYGRFQWGFHRKPRFVSLEYRIRRLDERGQVLQKVGPEEIKESHDLIHKYLWDGIRFADYNQVLYAVKRGVDVNNPGSYGRTPILALCSKEWKGRSGSFINETKIARLLIENGADLSVRDQFQATPLHWAAFWGKSRIVRYLIDKKVNVHAVDHQNKTPLDYAMKQERDYLMLRKQGRWMISKDRVLEGKWHSELRKVIRLLLQAGAKDRH
ncbi:MAG: hypothetical protein IEMM0008_1507 [bacterium]|nr:MAG: hypothetical protein IEMM0008_1507 [bacterium]